MTTYRDSGVDQAGADALVTRFAKHAARTKRLEGVGDLGGFGGMFSLGFLRDRGHARPALVVSTDGVGTKTELLRRAGRHDVAGWDAVAMNADDVVCAGAEPLLFVDYISIERLDPGVVEAIVSGVADGCVEAGCELAGGETSQHPGVMLPETYDVVGTCVGVVDLDRAWGPDRVRAGDAIVGLPASGPHANGFSLVRSVLAEDELPPAGFLEPTAIYARRVLAAAQRAEVHAAAHVTGGGIAGNLERVLPDGLGARVETAAWPRPSYLDWLVERGVAEDDLRATFNLGLGMLIVTPEPDAFDGPVVGEVIAASGVELA